MFELAGGRGAWVKITRREQVAGQESQTPQTVNIGAAFSEAGHPLVGGVKEMTQLPPDQASSSDVQKLAEYVESHGHLPTDLQGMANFGAPVSSRLVSFLNRILTWASIIVIFAALAVAAVALWTLNAPPHPH